MTTAQRRLLVHIRDWHDGVLGGQTGTWGAAWDAIIASCHRRGWLIDNALTDVGYAALKEAEAGR